jgi:hypothetical protein
MSSRPLPGASYHTIETILHSFANADLEAVGSLESLEYPSEKTSQESTPLLKSRVRSRHGLPLVLGLIVFFCLAFTASAFLGYSASRWLMPDVPDRHLSVAHHLSSAFQEQSYRTLVNELYNDALATLCVRVSHLFFSHSCVSSSPDLLLGISLGTRNSIVYVMVNVRNPMCGNLSSGLSLFCACAVVPFHMSRNGN